MTPFDAAKATEFGPWHAVGSDDRTLCGRSVLAWPWNIDHRWDDDLDLRCERCARSAERCCANCGQKIMWVIDLAQAEQGLWAHLLAQSCDDPQPSAQVRS